jgi:uncharacterized protein YegJ (DUF2314 family)
MLCAVVLRWGCGLIIPVEQVDWSAWLRVVFSGLLGGVAVALISWGVRWWQAPVSRVRLDDPRMSAAIARARERLPEFWRMFDNPPADVDEFALKVRLRDGEITENIWICDLMRTVDGLSGAVGNDPIGLSNMEAGQRVAIIENDICDWSFLRRGKMVGNETLRVMMEGQPAWRTRRFRDMFETSW